MFTAPASRHRHPRIVARGCCAAAVYASALDAAGNAIDNVTLAPETTYYNAGLTSITSIVTKPGSLTATDNSADITCTAKGAQKMQLKTTNASSVSIKSAVLDLFCSGGVVTYAASSADARGVRTR